MTEDEQKAVTRKVTYALCEFINSFEAPLVVKVDALANIVASIAAGLDNADREILVDTILKTIEATIQAAREQDLSPDRFLVAKQPTKTVH